MRGWSHGKKTTSKYPAEVRSERCGWCWSSKASTSRSGRRLRRSRRRSAARPRRCGKWVRQAERDAGQRPGADDGRARAAEGAGARESRAEARERDSAQGVGVFRPGGARPPTEVMVAFIDEHRDEYGVEPICDGAADRPVDVLRAHTARARDPDASARRARSATTSCAPKIRRVLERELRRCTAPRRCGGSSAARGDASRAAPSSG